MSDFNKLTELFLKFPSIGSRQAKRFAYFISRADKRYVSELSGAMERLASQAKRCKRCTRLFFEEGDICSICSSPTRDHGALCVVEKDVDLDKIERSGLYNGLYFVLGGVLPLRTEEPEKAIRADKLKSAVEQSFEEGLSEIILALNFTPESEYTLDFVKKLLTPLIENKDVKLSTLGRGLSLGSEVEYADKETLKNALENRK